MSLNNAVKYREEMNATYKKLLETTTSEEGREAIQKQIDFNNEEIAQLKIGKPLFGKVVTLKPTTTVIEKSNKDNVGEIKTTILNAPKETVTHPSANTDSTTTPTRLTNKSRGLFQSKVASTTENSLKEQIAAAKAAKK